MERMAKKGLLFRLRKDQTVRYGAVPYVVGIFEFQVKSLDRELALDMNEYFETVQTYYPRLRGTHIPQILSHVGTRLLDVMFGLIAQTNPYPSGAISCWNLRLPVMPGTMNQTIGLEPKFPTIHDGIPDVLDDSISFYWLPSNLDRL